MVTMNINHNNNGGNNSDEQRKVFYFTCDGAGTVSATVRLSDGLNLIQSIREQGWYFVRALMVDDGAAR